MSDSVNKPPEMGYDEFYRTGGWTYDLASEVLFLHFRVMQPLGIGCGRALELGCGTGVHSEALRQLMGRAHGVDSSAAAIEIARDQFPKTRFTQSDALDFLQGDVESDLIFVRGMSWFHYALEPDTSPHRLDALMRASMAALPRGAHFVLQIRTDFSGTTDVATGIRHHRVSDLRTWASRYGTLRMLTDWMGLPLQTNRDGRASGRNALIALAKP